MKRSYKDILRRDKDSVSEINDILNNGANIPAAMRSGISSNAVTKAMVGPVGELPRAEAMILMHLRPALLIKHNKIESPDSAEVRKRLIPYLPKIESVLPSVGRIDFLKMGRPFGGTGWMITEDILVTNRHVAKLFAEKKGKGFVFRKNALGENIEAFIDFKEEYAGRDKPRPEFEVPIEKILYIAEQGASNADIAFVKIGRHSKMPVPIPLSDVNLRNDQYISVVGYPAYDPDGIISASSAANVFNNIYEVKRCSPGEVIEFNNSGWYFFHDCTTLGGNSGSVVIDNLSGVAVGLHFMGEVGKENYAVKGKEILKHLQKLKPAIAVKNIDTSPETGKEENIKNLEAAPASYSDRAGYDPAFLGSRYKVPFPTIIKNKTHVLKFKEGTRSLDELKYHHFSVVMNKKRRLCFFSACNIDGMLSKRGVARTTWKTDSRIGKEFQIIKECYGNPPKFSRGHMTRKEDPIWGSISTAKAACSDTFHVTNATPQMQPFNAPVWLALEDYALENARQDEMKITVITGPIFKADDPVKYDVQVPTEFFKIIAFIHDETNKLCATGYTVSQEDYLSNAEFVYGQFNTYQRSIKSIERETGIKFGNLAAADPIKGEEFVRTPLASVGEMRFL